MHIAWAIVDRTHNEASSRPRQGTFSTTSIAPSANESTNM